MLALLSPAKKIDFEIPPIVQEHSQPDFLDEAQELVDQARTLKPEDLSRLMKISDDLGTLNAQRFNAFETPFTLANAKQAIHLFRGDVYQGLDPDTLDEAALAFAQNHVLILSGLFGLLRPLDLAQPYRLEMGTRFRINGHSNLYQFWGDKLTSAINERASEQAKIGVQPAIINLASSEYFSAVKRKDLYAPLITPEFREERDGQMKMISFFAKRARGQMARFMIDERLDQPDGLKDFARDGYRYRADLSTDGVWVFARPDSRR